MGWGIPGLYVCRLAVRLLGLRVYHYGQSLKLFAVSHFEQYFEQVLRAVDDILGELTHSFVFEEGVHPPPDDFTVDGELGRRHLFVRVMELVHSVSIIGRFQVDNIIWLFLFQFFDVVRRCDVVGRHQFVPVLRV